MQRTALVIILALILSACRPAPDDGGGGGQFIPETTSQGPISFNTAVAEMTPTPTLEIGLSLDQPIPRVNWSNDPQSTVVLATYCCGSLPDFVQRNYIPDAHIWGDGRIVWSEIGINNQRSVLEGHLAEEKLSALLQSVAGQGFFSWPKLFTAPLMPNNLAEKCLAISLTNLPHTVCEYGEGAPIAFQALYALVSEGAGADGSPYTPTTGYLVSYPVQGPGQAEYSGPIWNAQENGISLAQATSGAWLQGQPLQTVWNLINASPYSTLVIENGSPYNISLQIPGVSFQAPPER